MYRKKTTSSRPKQASGPTRYLININVKVHHDQHDIYLRFFLRNIESNKPRNALRATCNRRAGPNRPTRVSKHISDVNRRLTNIAIIKANKKTDKMLKETLAENQRLSKDTLLWFNSSSHMIGTLVMMHICSLLLYCL